MQNNYACIVLISFKNLKLGRFATVRGCFSMFSQYKTKEYVSFNNKGFRSPQI